MSNIDLSKKAKEKTADSFMSMSTNLYSAFLITLFVAPIGAVMSTLFTATPNEISLHTIGQLFIDARFWIFAICEICTISLAAKFREKAQYIYNEIFPD